MQESDEKSFSLSKTFRKILVCRLCELELTEAMELCCCKSGVKQKKN